MTNCIQLASQIKTPIHHGYRLGFYKLPSGRLFETLIQIELLSSSKVVDERQHEIYDYLKTDLMKIVKIENPPTDGIVYLNYCPELTYPIQINDIVRFKHSDFNHPTPDQTYFMYYTTQVGALNNSKSIDHHFKASFALTSTSTSAMTDSDRTGVIYQYYNNGKIKNKKYYVWGMLATTYGYYNNDLNSLHYTWIYTQHENQTFPTIREYVYNQVEVPMAQYIINESRVVHQTIYAPPDQYPSSIYLQIGEL